jgi:hypothetical protein
VDTNVNAIRPLAYATNQSKWKQNPPNQQNLVMTIADLKIIRYVMNKVACAGARPVIFNHLALEVLANLKTSVRLGITIVMEMQFALIELLVIHAYVKMAMKGQVSVEHAEI